MLLSCSCGLIAKLYHLEGKMHVERDLTYILVICIISDDIFIEISFNVTKLLPLV